MVAVVVTVVVVKRRVSRTNVCNRVNKGFNKGRVSTLVPPSLFNSLVVSLMRKEL